MTSKFNRLFLAMVLFLALAPGAFAKGGHGNGHGGDKEKHHDKDSHADRDHDRDGDHDRDDDKRPAGWDKGKKKGWGDCDVPPGQVKKQGCHPDSHHHVAHHDRDRDHDRDHDRVAHRDYDRDRDHHTSTVKPATTTTTVKKTTTTTASAKTPQQGRRKVFNDDGTWHYEGATAKK